MPLEAVNCEYIPTLPAEVSFWHGFKHLQVIRITEICVIGLFTFLKGGVNKPTM